MVRVRVRVRIRVRVGVAFEGSLVVGVMWPTSRGVCRHGADNLI